MRTHMYRLLSSSDEVLYVGITNNFDQRMSAHATEKKWWGEVDYFVVRTYSSRTEAEAAERREISKFAPKYNELPGVKVNATRRLEDRRAPKTHSNLPPEEIEYLKTLSSEQTYARCVELQHAGWSVVSMLQGAKVSPTLQQLQVELKYRTHTPTGVPVPQPPKSRSERSKESKEKLEKDNYLSDIEKSLLKDYSDKSKRYRPQYGPTHPLYEAVDEYKELITELHNRGVAFSTMANVVGVNESNIRRRYIKSH